MATNKETVLGPTLIVLGFLVLLSLPITARAEAGAGRFFLMGDGKIHIKNAQTGKEAEVRLLAPDGSLNEEGLNRIDEVFGFPTREKGKHISPRLLFMLDYFSDLVAPGKLVHMTSGYRSPEHNTDLRNAGGTVAKTSQHLDGMALDFDIDGVNGKKLWEIIRSKECCGAGYYGGATVHLDSGRPRFWETATSKVRTGESDHNKRIYLSTDYDRYKAGDTVRLSFSSISDFGFGIKPAISFVDDPEGSHTVSTARAAGKDNTDCAMIEDEKTARFISLTLPPGLREGRYRIRIDFCRNPFEDMLSKTLSNEIEILKGTP